VSGLWCCIAALSCLVARAQTAAPGKQHLERRFRWFVQSTVGPAALAGGVVSSAFATALNRPEEYGPHWAGFGKRYGMRLTGISTGKAGLGALWAENPRYERRGRGSVLTRIGASLKMTVAAQGASADELRPAYARYLGIVGNNFLSNTWRTRSEADAAHAGMRVGLGFAGRAASNAFEEFWPSVQCRLRRRGWRS
jgi:hypothetical protein